VLACAPSNIAVDNIVERLVEYNNNVNNNNNNNNKRNIRNKKNDKNNARRTLKICRIGHPGKI